MRQRYYQLTKNQPKVRVIAQGYDDPFDKVKFAVLAVVSAGIFYFFGNGLWHALTGG